MKLSEVPASNKITAKVPASSEITVGCSESKLNTFDQTIPRLGSPRSQLLKNNETSNMCELIQEKTTLFHI